MPTAVILLLIVLMPSLLHAAQMDRIVAVVNKEPITWSELYRTMESEMLKQGARLSDSEKAKVFKENEARFLDNMIDMRLQTQEARRLGLGISETELSAAIDAVRKRNNIGINEFKELLLKEGIEFEDYKKLLREDLLISKLIDREVRSKITPSQGEIEAYVSANSKKQNQSELYHIKHILVKTGNTEEKSEKLYQRLKAGEDFSALAKQYSEDASAKNGGDLGLLKKDVLMPEFKDTLKKMNPGDISKPFKTSSGFHIVKLEGVKSEASNEEIINRFLDEMFSIELKKWMKALREQSFIEIRL